ncbi:hypothetical protein L593_11495 [Salinarchaeum sp. Harcht-Bsk1]|uniref:DUF7344 domain-containing protein n=1 Tax=Salinarchaeum sp. Harcht-Bsk1 TaxID=1333523 RepID=UPI0003424040|nr:hypothetical protein [Salinarchaeum sp. Harcht-Bsk1]AGN02242.1 hypothetical protein L593_11495 [Salinarchaeum sp. Harcht-Bsk1]
MFRTSTIPEAEIYEVLANDRRRATLRALARSSEDRGIPLSDLATAVAERETGASPPPAAARESVYNSLHQTHLPMLDELEIVRYDHDARTVYRRDRVRDVERYMEVVSALGISWSELYRTLGVCSLGLVTTALAGVDPVAGVDPLLWAIASLVTFAVAIAAQLWSNRRYVRRGRSG